MSLELDAISANPPSSGHKSREAIKVVRFQPSVSHGPFVVVDVHLGS